MTITPDWGPFAGPADAAKHLSDFVDDYLDRDLGVAWYSLAGLTPLRRPSYDASGIGACLVAQWNPSPPTPPAKPRGIYQEVKAAIKATLEAYGEGQMAQSEIAMSQAQALAKVLQPALGGDRWKDALGVGGDIVGVAIGIAVGCTGVGLVAELAFWGGAACLLMDGAAYGLEVSGHDDYATTLNKWDEPLRLVAAVAALTDAGWNGYRTFSEEIPKLRLERTSSMRTAARANADATRVAGSATGAADAARKVLAEKYAALGERANKRAADLASKLQRTWALDLAPKGVLTPAATALLVDSEIESQQPGPVAAFLGHYVFHVTAVTRNQKAG